MFLQKTKQFIILALTFVLTVSVIDARPADANSGCRMPVTKINFKVKKDNVVDLTYVFDENSAYWPSNPSGFDLIELFKGFVSSPSRFFYSSYFYSQPEHLGTHLDAPFHFSKTGDHTDAVSLYSLIGPGVLLDLKTDGEKFGRDSLVTIDHFLQWESKNRKQIRTGSIILIHTGYGDVYYNRSDYFGTNETGNEAVPLLRFPGLDPEAAEWLVTKRCIAAIGIDTASIDRGQSTDFRSHQILGASNVPIFENVANIDRLVERGKDFKIIALPQKIGGGSGGPLRIIAVTK